ncbi:unnamed protein product, partial [Laminaria digitata]
LLYYSDYLICSIISAPLHWALNRLSYLCTLLNPEPHRIPTKCRFHFLNHNETDCNMFCNPNKKDNPLLWHVDGDGRHVFKWNSSMAKSNNAFIAGLGHMVGKMPRTLGHFVLTTNVIVRN